MIAERLSELLQSDLCRFLRVKAFGLQVEERFLYLCKLFVLSFGQRLCCSFPGRLRVDPQPALRDPRMTQLDALIPHLGIYPNPLAKGPSLRNDPKHVFGGAGHPGDKGKTR